MEDRLARRYEGVRERSCAALHLPRAESHAAAAWAAANSLAVQLSHPGPAMGLLVLLFGRALGRRPRGADERSPDDAAATQMEAAGTSVWAAAKVRLLGKSSAGERSPRHGC